MSSIIKVDTVQDQDGNNIINENANTITIGASGDTITIPSGATLANNGTATGFASIAWQSVVTASTLTTVAGKGYPINTTSNACTVTLPAAASVGDQVQIVDYAGTFATNNITLTSTLNIEGGTDDKLLTTNREGVIITYVDATQGWVATSGVNEGTDALSPFYSVDYLVVAGGGGSGANDGGGGGAGGYLTSTASFSPTVVYTVTIGGGGAGSTGTTAPNSGGTNGVNSSISGTGLTTITSIGGGAGGGQGGVTGQNGGSGGGGGNGNVNGSGTVSQGNDGGTGVGGNGGGGGGAGAVGTTGPVSAGGTGGVGLQSSINGTSTYYAGGGGGASYGPGGGTTGPGGLGGGGNSGLAGSAGTAGTVNTGGGAGGSDQTTGSTGGSGIVILSMLDAKYSGTTTGSPTVATGVSGKTVLTFTGSGSYTA